MAKTLVDGNVASSGDDHAKATPVKAVESAYIKDLCAVVSGLEQIESVFGSGVTSVLDNKFDLKPAVLSSSVQESAELNNHS